MSDAGGLVRPDVTESDAARIASECYGIEVVASELGSNQDRNFLLTEPDGAKSVLRIDNQAFSDAAREAQHAALDAYRAAGVPREYLKGVAPNPCGQSQVSVGGGY